jgi:hypothetical protein
MIRQVLRRLQRLAVFVEPRDPGPLLQMAAAEQD